MSTKIDKTVILIIEVIQVIIKKKKKLQVGEERETKDLKGQYLLTDFHAFECIAC